MIASGQGVIAITFIVLWPRRSSSKTDHQNMQPSLVTMSVKATNSKGELVTVARIEKKMSTRIDEAVQIAKDASALGHQDAMAVLSDMHLYGVGVEKNEEESMRLMMLLSKGGKNARSMYLHGLKLLKDDKLRAGGIVWLKKAETAGSREAAILLDFLFQEGTVNNVIRTRDETTYDIFVPKK